LWLRLAGHANAMARRIADGLAGIPGIRLLHPVEANELFVVLTDVAIAKLEQEGYLFYRWESDEGPCIRLVTAFDTQAQAVDSFLQAFARAAA